MRSHTRWASVKHENSCIITVGHGRLMERGEWGGIVGDLCLISLSVARRFVLSALGPPTVCYYTSYMYMIILFIKNDQFHFVSTGRPIKTNSTKI